MVAAAVIGGAVVGAGASTISSNKASKASRQAADATVAENRRQFDLVRQDTAPARELGVGAVGELKRLQGGDLSGFHADPGYQFARDEGLQSVQRNAIAQGRSISGSEDKALTRYGTGVANQQYGAFVDRLLQQAGLGNTGIGASAAAGANATTNIGNAYTNAGNARANAYLTAGQGINNAVQGGTSNFLLMKYLGSGGSNGSAIRG
jgi:hypothetical protein